MKALAFDAYGTLFDVYSVTALCEQLFPGHGNALATMWRAKQLQYSVLRSLMNRYKDFWQVTQDGLVYSAKSLKLDLTAKKPACRGRRHRRIKPHLIPNVIFVGYLLRFALFGGFDLLVL